jgi:putative two-component system response regulator
MARIIAVHLPAVMPYPENNRPKILVIDDDPAVGSVIKVRLGDAFRVVVTTDPAQAVALARSEKPDVILCDIDMPGMQGDEVAWALSEDRTTQFIPLIYLSSLVRPRDSGSDLDGPFGGYPAVSKSAPAKELREIIGGVLGPRY